MPKVPVLSPCGATTITGGAGARMPRENKLGAARWQGRYVAGTAKTPFG